MIKPKPDDRRDLLRTAHQWRERMARPKISDKDRDAFEKWRAADPLNGQMYDHAVTFFHALGTLTQEDLAPDVTGKTARERWLSAKADIADLFKRRSLGLAVAATSLASIIATLVLITVFGNADQSRNLPRVAMYESANGEIKELKLSDGSTVTLGAASSLQTSFTKSKREAILLSGQALFSIAKDPSRMFTVTAGDLTAKVLGTVFDIKRSVDIVRVGVREGSVEISFPMVVNEQPLSMRTKQRVTSGQQVTATQKDGLKSIKKVDPSLIAAWRADKLTYNGASLIELLEDASRYSSQRIVIDGDRAAMSDYKVQGSFKATDIDGMLSALPILYPVEIDRSEPGRVQVRAIDKHP
ncbi:MAG: FecR domain-containing protein [Pseudomonadota bacterium]